MQLTQQKAGNGADSESLFNAVLFGHAYSSYDEYLKEQMELLTLYISIALRRREEADPALFGVVITKDQAMAMLDSDSAASQANGDALAIRARKHVKSRVRSTTAAAAFAPESIFKAFAFDDFDQLCFFTALSVEYSRKFETLFAYLNDYIAMQYPTVGVARALYDIAYGSKNAPAPQAFLASVASTRRRLIFSVESVAEKADTAFATKLLLQKKALQFALGNNEITPELLNACAFLQGGGESLRLLSVVDCDVPEQIVSLLENRAAMRAVVNLYGPALSGRRTALSRFSKDAGIRVLEIHVQKLLLGNEAIEKLAEALLSEQFLSGALLLLTELGNEENKEKEQRLLEALLKESRLILIVSEEAFTALPKGAQAYHIPFKLPNAADSLLLWKHYLGEWGKHIDAAPFVSKYRLAPGRIQSAAQGASLRAIANGRPLMAHDITESIRKTCVHHMHKQAELIEPRYHWEDLVLSDGAQKELRTICHRVQYRTVVMEQWGFEGKLAYGKSVSALFYGVPGTGKTMAAQVIANELDLELYRADVSRLFNKYIGETEKNLASLFDEAKNSNAILFFDEADALFAKRIEVTSANDRFANVETAYLLQRIEQYEGVVIMATNLAHNFDEAFKRRIAHMVRFDKPDMARRLLLWQKSFPKGAPFENELDFVFLAESFELTGSVIKSIALTSAYHAAAAGEAIGMRHIIRALKGEYEKSGEILVRAQLGAYDID